MAEQDQTQSYRDFAKAKEELVPAVMDKRNVVISVSRFAHPKRSQLLQGIAETLHLPLINSAMLDNGLKPLLYDNPPHGYVFDELPTSTEELAVVEGWLAEVGMTMHTVDVSGSKRLTVPSKVKTIQHVLDTKNAESLERQFFRAISPHCFEDPNLADDYYRFVDICLKLNVPHILIAGACSYIYWGRRPLKDIDVLVPSHDDLKKISTEADKPIEHIISPYADTQFLNFSSGVEPVSDLVVTYDSQGTQQRVPFTFDELMSDARTVRFMGESCTLMSPEMLVLFKFSLGRFGIDQWKHHKDDYEDARGVLVSQTVDWNSLEKRARRLGAFERVALGRKILGE